LGQPRDVYSHPARTGGATRVEIRVGDGAANPYLATAAVLLAGAEGVREQLAPPPPVSGDAYRADPDVIGDELPKTLEAALDALEADQLLCDGLGPEIVQTFLAMKRFEIERHRNWVSTGRSPSTSTTSSVVKRKFDTSLGASGRACREAATPPYHQYVSCHRLPPTTPVQHPSWHRISASRH